MGMNLTTFRLVGLQTVKVPAVALVPEDGKMIITC